MIKYNQIKDLYIFEQNQIVKDYLIRLLERYVSWQRKYNRPLAYTPLIKSFGCIVRADAMLFELKTNTTLSQAYVELIRQAIKEDFEPKMKQYVHPKYSAKELTKLAKMIAKANR